MIFLTVVLNGSTQHFSKLELHLIAATGLNVMLFNTSQVRKSQGTAPTCNTKEAPGSSARTAVTAGGDGPVHSRAMNGQSMLWPTGTPLPGPYHTLFQTLPCDLVLFNIHNKPPNHTWLLSLLHRQQNEGTRYLRNLPKDKSW